MRGGRKTIFNKPKKKNVFVGCGTLRRSVRNDSAILLYYYNNYAECATVPRSVHGPARLQVLPPPRKRRVVASYSVIFNG